MDQAEKILRKQFKKCQNKSYNDGWLKLLREIAREFNIKEPVSAIDYDMTYKEWQKNKENK